MGRNLHGRKTLMNSCFIKSRFSLRFNFFSIIIASIAVFLCSFKTFANSSAQTIEQTSKGVQTLQKNEKPAYKSIGFPGTQKKQVEALRKKYLTTHKKWLYNILEEGEQYRIFVRNELKKRNMPAILEYLPLVESNFNPNARSRSGATGLWQFMLNSVAGYLEYDEYVDQRLDPWISTEAALSKLQDNYKVFGDWLLAITAYNCGAGAMKKAIKSAGKKDFWYLSENGFLSQQASGYVPKLIALADVAENTSYYGISLPTARDKNGKTIDSGAGKFDYVTVKESVHIERLASELRIDKDTLKELNSALRKNITPPNKEYAIRLPLGMKESAEYVLNEMGVFTIKSNKTSR